MENYIRKQQKNNILKKSLSNAIATNFLLIGFMVYAIYLIIQFDKVIGNGITYIFNNITQTYSLIFTFSAYIAFILMSGICFSLIKIRNKPLIQNKTRKILENIIALCFCYNSLIFYLMGIWIASFGIKGSNLIPPIDSSVYIAILVLLHFILISYIIYSNTYYKFYKKYIINIIYNTQKNNKKQNNKRKQKNKQNKTQYKTEQNQKIKSITQLVQQHSATIKKESISITLLNCVSSLLFFVIFYLLPVCIISIICYG